MTDYKCNAYSQSKLLINNQKMEIESIYFIVLLLNKPMCKLFV